MGVRKPPAPSDEVMRRLGGTARVWRTDRLATVILPGTRDVQASFVPVAKHYLLTEQELA